jgi:subtilisin family serine protease
MNQLSKGQDQTFIGEFMDPNTGERVHFAIDVDGHGTHVAGIVGSSDVAYTGIAPGVNIIALRVLGDDVCGHFGDLFGC